MKGAHQTSANLFAALMRVWSRMAVPCIAVKDEDGTVKAVRLAPNLARELGRAGYTEGKDFHCEVEVPHPSLVDEVYRKIKAPLVEIFEAILGDLERQELADRRQLKAIRDILEHEYGKYPSFQVQDRSSVVAERTERYGAVRRLYGISAIRSREQLEAVGVRPLWGSLVALSCDPGDGGEALQRMAERAIEHGVRPERVEF